MFKNIFNISVLVFALVSVQFFSSCNDGDDPQPEVKKGTFKLEFEHGWGSTYDYFELDTFLKHPMTGDTIKFTKLQYYISNIKLQKTDGSWWSQNESYYLVDISQPDGNLLSIPGVPAGEYKGIAFTVGVDSARNVSGAQTGVLSPTYGMFWPWSGYIHIKAEGRSPNSTSGAFTYHLGGYSGADNAINSYSCTFGATNMMIRPDGTPQIHMMVNAARFWHGGVKLKDLSGIHAPGAAAVSMAKNFADGIIFEHLHN